LEYPDTCLTCGYPVDENGETCGKDDCRSEFDNMIEAVIDTFGMQINPVPEIS